MFSAFALPRDSMSSFNQYRTGKTPDFGDNHVNQHRPNLESAVCIVEIR